MSPPFLSLGLNGCKLIGTLPPALLHASNRSLNWIGTHSPKKKSRHKHRSNFEELIPPFLRNRYALLCRVFLLMPSLTRPESMPC